MASNKEKQPTYYDSIIGSGFSRRDFMKFSAFMAAYLGYETSSIGQIEKALKKTPRLPIIWEHFQECTCCSESFIRTNHPIVSEILLDKVSLDYTLTLMAASGHQAEAAKHDTMKKYKGEYILAVEGSVPMGADGVYCCIAGKTALDQLREAAAGAKAIVAWGSCACNGCVQSAKPNPTEATPIHEIITDKPIINVPGCPPIGEVMAGVIVHVVAFGKLPELDRQGRPKAFYNKRVHDSCYRRPYFDAGLFVEDFDDENARKGYCLYKVGCKGPVTYNACGGIRWNNGVSYPIQSGHGCFGCSENNFWDNGPIYERLATFSGFGIESNADTIGKVAAGAVAGAAAVHGVTAALSKNKNVNKDISEGKEVEKRLED